MPTRLHVVAQGCWPCVPWRKKASSVPCTSMATMSQSLRPSPAVPGQSPLTCSTAPLAQSVDEQEEGREVHHVTDEPEDVHFCQRWGGFRTFCQSRRF